MSVFAEITPASHSALSIGFQVDHDRFDAAMDAMNAVLADGTGNESVKSGIQEGAAVYMGFIRRRYSTAMMSPGNPWADIKPSTKYARLHFTRTKGVTKAMRFTMLESVQLPILYDTGTLYTSFVPGEPGWSEFWRPDGGSFGSAIEYSKYHQDGTDRMPARVILVLPDDETLTSIGASVAGGLQIAFNGVIS